MRDKTLLFFVLIFCFSFTQVIGQVDKNAEKLQRLKEKVERYELKVADRERKVEIADSLLIVGEEKITEAEEKFTEVDNQQRQIGKEYKANLKPLLKQQRSKDGAVSKQATTDLKALDSQYRKDLKELENQVKILTKQATSGKNNIAKGKEKKKMYSKALEEAQEYLDAARAAYDSALNNQE